MPHKSGRGWLRCGGWESGEHCTCSILLCWGLVPAASSSRVTTRTLPPLGRHGHIHGETCRADHSCCRGSHETPETAPETGNNVHTQCKQNVAPIILQKAARLPTLAGPARRRAAVRSPTLSTLRLQAAPVEFQTLTAAHVYQLHSIYSTVTSTQRQLYHRWEQALRWPWRNQ